LGENGRNSPLRPGVARKSEDGATKAIMTKHHTPGS